MLIRRLGKKHAKGIIRTNQFRFYRTSDYIGTVAVEMDNVVDYEVGRVWVNQEKFECVYAKMGIEDDKYTRNLIISGDDFETLLVKLKGKEVSTPEQVLNSI